MQIINKNKSSYKKIQCLIKLLIKFSNFKLFF